MKLFCSKNSRKKGRLAFTLVDVMVAMAILGISLLALFGGFSFGFNVVKNSRENLRATQILQEKMETLRVYTWPQLTNANYIPTNFVVKLHTNGPVYYSGTVVITNATLDDNPAYSNTLRQVIVTLNWTNNNLRRTRSTSTFVSKHGLQRYSLN